MDEQDSDKFLKTGISGFDALFEHGLPKGKNVIIEGSPGTGKTIFCLHLTNNLCMQGKKVLYMSFEESEQSLTEHMEDFGWNPADLVEKGHLKLKRFSAIDIARSVEALLSAAKRELLIAIEPVLIPKDFDPEVIIVDSISSISSAFSGEEHRFRVYIEQLFRYLEDKQMSSYLVKENPVPTHRGTIASGENRGAISFLSDGIICLYNVVYSDGRRGNAMEILKMRGTDFRKVTVAYEVNPSQGIIVFPNRELEGEYTLT